MKTEGLFSIKGYSFNLFINFIRSLFKVHASVKEREREKGERKEKGEKKGEKKKKRKKKEEKTRKNRGERVWLGKSRSDIMRDMTETEILGTVGEDICCYRNDINHQ